MSMITVVCFNLIQQTPPNARKTHQSPKCAAQISLSLCLSAITVYSSFHNVCVIPVTQELHRQQCRNMTFTYHHLMKLIRQMRFRKETWIKMWNIKKKNLIDIQYSPSIKLCFGLHEAAVAQEEFQLFWSTCQSASGKITNLKFAPYGWSLVCECAVWAPDVQVGILQRNHLPLVCEWVNTDLSFDYSSALGSRKTREALDKNSPFTMRRHGSLTAKTHYCWTFLYRKSFWCIARNANLFGFQVQ